MLGPVVAYHGTVSPSFSAPIMERDQGHPLDHINRKNASIFTVAPIACVRLRTNPVFALHHRRGMHRLTSEASIIYHRAITSLQVVCIKLKRDEHRADPE